MEEALSKRHQTTQFRIRRNESIGAADAESDEKFLLQCFVDNGDLASLRDCEDGKRIIVGRTGAGKSALLRMLKEYEKNVVELQPENLALRYLATSEVLRFFEDAGSNLDAFYQLLWKHVIVVELIRHRYKITNEQSQKSFFERLTSVFTRNKSKEQAMRYLQDWGNAFWNETETRVREVTTKIEGALKASLEGSVLGTKIDAGASKNLSTEEKADVTRRGNKAVSELQLAALSHVLKLLEEEIFTDAQESHYIVIDDLDTQWVQDPLKYKLIRALIECVRSFRQVKRVKIIVAIRLDLLKRVIRATKDAGFQSEKYESLYLRLRWDSSQLHELLNKRIARLLSEAYTTKSIPLENLFPKTILQSKFIDYIAERTFLRPRDAILFVNECLVRAAGKQIVNQQIIFDAEAAFSQKRSDSLQEEWSGVYDHIDDYLKLLARKSSTFPVSEFSQGALEDWMMSNLLGDQPSHDPVVIAARRFLVENKGTFFDRGFIRHGCTWYQT